MNKIEQLLEKYCPNGVEFKELKEIADFSQGIQIDVEKQFPDIQEGFVRFLRIVDFVKDDEIPRYIDNPGSRYIKKEDDLVMIRYGASAAGKVFLEYEGAIANNMFQIKLKTEKLSTKFLYCYLSQTKIYNHLNSNGGTSTMPAITFGQIGSVIIPIPPIEVQQEIVKILDTFTSLEAELEAELEARKSQYEYYRDEMLSFGDEEVEWKSLGEVCFYSKSRISAKDLNNENYVGVDNLLQNKQGKTISNYVPTSGNLTKYEVGDILIGNIRPYLRKIWRAENIGGTNGDVLVIRIQEKDYIVSEYLYYLLSSEKFCNYSMQYAKGAKMPRGNKDAIMKFSIPIPSLDKQQQIVATLDQFDALVNDISIGLPAELQARRQQYEYYREKLLTFRELQK